MLGKLMKYEIKSCGRIFFPLYIVVLLFSILSGLFINFDDGMHNFEIVYAIGVLVAFGLFVAMVVLTILFIVQRFNKSFLGDEGYLMFTLPVSQKKLVLSKFFTSLIFIIMTSIVVLASIFIVAITASYKLNDVIDIAAILSTTGTIIVDNLLNIIFYIFNILVDYSVFILTIYLAITIAHLPIFSKHKIIAALGALIILSIIQTLALNTVNLIVPDVLTEQVETILDKFILQDPWDIELFCKVILSVTSYQIGIFVVNLLIAIASFFGISYLLENKLDLE